MSNLSLFHQTTSNRATFKFKYLYEEVEIGNIFLEQSHLQLFCSLKVTKGCLFCISLLIVVTSWQLFETLCTKGTCFVIIRKVTHNEGILLPVSKMLLGDPIRKLRKAFSFTTVCPLDTQGHLVICFTAVPMCMVLTILNLQSSFNNQGRNSCSRNYGCAAQIKQFHLIMDSFCHIIAYKDYSFTFPDLEYQLLEDRGQRTSL